MDPEVKRPRGREIDEASIELLKQLTQKLCSNDISTARLAAFNLSWMQEDGLAILTKILYGNFPRTPKKAAAYGLRSMKGRMKKMAIVVLEQGLKHRDRTTRAACVKALSLMKGVTPTKGSSREKRSSGKTQIQGIEKRTKSNVEKNSKSSSK
jgi:hypothetical protein